GEIGDAGERPGGAAVVGFKRLGAGEQVFAAITGEGEIGKVEGDDRAVKGEGHAADRRVARVRRDGGDGDGGCVLVEFGGGDADRLAVAEIGGAGGIEGDEHGVGAILGGVGILDADGGR